jgi:hypothetical protein
MPSKELVDWSCECVTGTVPSDRMQVQEKLLMRLDMFEPRTPLSPES